MQLETRRQKILELLKENDYQSVENLAEHFKVSKVTIRSDLTALERRNLLYRVHGGAILPETPSPRNIDSTVFEYPDVKRRIAQAASAQIKPKMSVILDAGSTTLKVCPHLIADITVITGSLPALNLIAPRKDLEIIMLAGTLRRYSKGSIGYFARNMLKEIQSDMLLMGASSYSENGIYSSNVIEAETKKAMMRSAQTVCLLADSSKEDKGAPFKVCNWSEIDILITEKVSPALESELNQQGVKIILV